MYRDYLPQGDGAAVSWLTNFKTKIATHGESLGLLPAEVATLQADCAEWISRIQAVEAGKLELSGTIESKGATAKQKSAAIREAVRKMKASASYKDSIGEELGVKVTVPELDTANFKATISAERFAGHIRIKFVKNQTDGINLYHRKKGESAWKFLARDTKSPYDDHITLSVPGQPEHWEYRALAVIDDAEIGLPSDIVEMVFGA